MRGTRALTIGVMVAGAVTSAAGQDDHGRIAVGDAVVMPQRLRAFDARWNTVSIQNGERRATGVLAERLEAGVEGGRPVWHRTQWREAGDRRIETRLTFDRKTLAPIRLEHVKEGDFPPQVVRAFSVRYGPGGASGEQTLASGETRPIRNMTMGSAGFETDIMGLVLATLPLRPGYRAELPSVHGQLGEQYYIRPQVTGTQDFQAADGSTVTAWKVEVEWLNLRTQDVYTPGDTGSGGTYYVVTDPPDGFPFVPRYVNENTDIVVTFSAGDAG